MTAPVNANARKRLHRAARLGQRPVPQTRSVADALRTIDAVRAYRDEWSTSADPFPATVRVAWAAR